MNAIETVSELVNVPAETLEEFTLPPARTIFISDRKTVFAKHTVHDGKQELIGSLEAIAQGIRTPSVLGYKSLGERAIIAFEYLPDRFTPLPDPIDVLQSVWNAIPPKEARYIGLLEKQARAQANLLFISESAEKQRILPVIEQQHTESESLLSTGKIWETAWLHGDAHGRNIFLYNAEPIVLDWEWHGVGWRELDLGKWFQVLISEDGNPDDVLPVWDRMKADTTLDPELVKLEIRQSAARAYTYQLRWQTKLEWLDGLYDLAVGETALYKELH